MKAQEFQDYVKRPRAGTRLGCICMVSTSSMERREDLKSEEPVRRRRFEHKLEEFHRSLLEQGYTVNSCRTMTLGLIQLFNYFDMDMKAKVISAD